MSKTNSSVVVVDYGLGNLKSVCRSFSKVGAEVTLTSSPEDVANAERLVLPGVGAYGNAMSRIRDLELIGGIQSFAAKQRPFLGICLGMQLLLESSEEFGSCEGLGVIPGVVRPIPTGSGAPGTGIKVPHIGWSQLSEDNQSAKWESTLFRRVKAEDYFYFVHSFMACPKNDEHTLATYEYDGIDIVGAVVLGNIVGCQFHPEKSGQAGLKILEEFMEI